MMDDETARELSDGMPDGLTRAELAAIDEFWTAIYWAMRKDSRDIRVAEALARAVRQLRDQRDERPRLA